MRSKRPLGFWIIMVVGALLLLMLFVGQMMAFIDYDFTVSIGMQEPAEMIGEMGVAMNKGFGVGDTIVYIPFLLCGLIGLWLRKMWGVFAMVGALAITAYWPVVAFFALLFAKGAPGFKFADFTTYTLFLTPIFLFGLWGSWYLYKNRTILAESTRS